MSDDGTKVEVEWLGCIGAILILCLIIFLYNHGGEFADLFMQWLRQQVAG